jgi:hypothetical protein
MTAPLSPRQSALLALVPVDGSAIGNASLREQLGWEEASYFAVRDELVAAGILEKGKGRGGSVKRVVTAAPRAELFAPEEVESVLPELDRACHATAKSHIDQVVLDTDTWERSVAFQLEACPAVACFARNDQLGFEIKYEFLGGAHKFLPDFLVRLRNGVTLILEVKGFHGEKEDHKFQAAKRWVSAVNNWGRMGRWDFHVGRNLDALQTEIESLNQRPIG